MTVIFAARFVAPAALHSLVLAAELAASPDPDGVAQVWIVDPDGGEWRHGQVVGAHKGGAHVVLGFPAFACPAGTICHVVVTAGAGVATAVLPDWLHVLLAVESAPIPIATPELEVALPARPARGIFVIAEGRVAAGNRAPAGFPVTADYGAHWRDEFGAYLSGWVHCTEWPVQRLFLRLGTRESELTLIPFPDVIAYYPACGEVVPVRWSGQVAGPPGEPLQLRVVTAAGERVVDVVLPERLANLPPPPPRVPALMARFMRMVNEEQLRVLEIGARLVAPGAQSWRGDMARAAAYIGMDIHPDANVDLVGDAHALSTLVAPGSLDAVWSGDVLEHLRMPWLVAAEVNRALRMGGLAFHVAPQTWPLHEMPADYWRFSDEGLRVLFGPEFGFEIIESAMIEPMRIISPHREAPHSEMLLHPGYGHALVLARKVAELPQVAGLEAMQRALVGASGRLYPETDMERQAGDKRVAAAAGG